jgi:hypothetical protein
VSLIEGVVQEAVRIELREPEPEFLNGTTELAVGFENYEKKIDSTEAHGNQKLADSLSQSMKAAQEKER